MEYYNIYFDTTLAEILRAINESTEFTLLNLPIKDTVNTLANSKAAIFRGKLTALDFPPYILQDLGYPGILMILIYFVEFIFILRSKTSPNMLKAARVSIFQALFIDYLDLALRTLGFFSFDNHHNIYDFISWFISIIILSVLTWELIQMALYSTKLWKVKNEKNLTKFEKDMKEMLFDSINPNALEKCWMARYYELVYLLRFYLICIFIFNLQFLRFSQVMGSVLICFTVTFLTIFFQVRYSILKSGYSLVFRMIQEVSLSLIISIIGLFYFDEEADGIMSRNLKLMFTSGMVILICINIILELLNGLFTVIIMGVTKIKSMRRGKISHKEAKILFSKSEGKNKAKMKINDEEVVNETEGKMISKKISNSAQISSRVIVSNPSNYVKRYLLHDTVLHQNGKKKNKRFQNKKRRKRRFISSQSKKTIQIKKYTAIGVSSKKIEHGDDNCARHNTSINNDNFDNNGHKGSSSLLTLNNNISIETLEFNREFENKNRLKDIKTPTNERITIKVKSSNGSRRNSSARRMKLFITSSDISDRKTNVKKRLLSKKQKTNFLLGSRRVQEDTKSIKKKMIRSFQGKILNPRDNSPINPAAKKQLLNIPQRRQNNLIAPSYSPYSSVSQKSLKSRRHLRSSRNLGKLFKYRKRSKNNSPEKSKESK